MITDGEDPSLHSTTVVESTVGTDGALADTARWDCAGIKVCVRVRPLSAAERVDPGVKQAVECLDDHVILDLTVGKSATRFLGARNAKPRPMQFPFHCVFHPNTSQLDVFDNTCSKIVLGSLLGINGAVMAYGATGSGKTYSMFGGVSSTPGITFQAAQMLFAERDRLMETQPEKSVHFSCSFMEVYNEEVFDLLGREGRSKPLIVQDAGNEADATLHNNNAEPFVLKGLTLHVPQTIEDFVEIVERGLRNRAVASTNANVQSSRSHAIVTVEVEVRNSSDSAGGTLARLRFCDLAGCERAAQHASCNERRREGAKINHSLLELGRVTQALACRSQQASKGRSTSKFISWRGSKLTRLMRDCLDGNCRTAMLICISPTSTSLENSRNAMLFAMKAKEVQMNARANEYCVDTPEIAREQARTIELLRCSNTALREALRSQGIDPDVVISEFAGEALRPHSPMKSSAMPTAQLKALQPPQHFDPMITSSTSSTAITPSKPTIVANMPDTPSQSTTTFARGSSPLEAQQQRALFYKRLNDDAMDAIRKKGEYDRSTKDVEIRKRTIDIKKRELYIQIAEHMARGGSGIEPDPFSIVNARKNLVKLDEDVRRLDAELVELEAGQTAVEAHSNRMLRQLQVDGADFFTDLILQRAKLHEDVTIAEGLSMGYHQGEQQTQERLKEYQATQDRLTAAIHNLLKFCPQDAEERRRSAIALSFADLTKTETSRMMDAFRSKLQDCNYVYGCTSSITSDVTTGKVTPGGSSFVIPVNAAMRRRDDAAAASSTPSTNSRNAAPHPAAARDSIKSGNVAAVRVVGGGNTAAFTRSATTIASLSASPASLLQQRCRTNWGFLLPNRDSAATTPTVPARKPPVPFTSGDTAAKTAVVAAATTSGISVRTPSGGNALLGQAIRGTAASQTSQPTTNAAVWNTSNVIAARK